MNISCPSCGNEFEPIEGKTVKNQMFFKRVIAICPNCGFVGNYDIFPKVGSTDTLDQLFKSRRDKFSETMMSVPTRSQGTGFKMDPSIFGIEPAVPQPIMQQTATSLTPIRVGKKFIRRSALKMLLDED